MIVALRKSDQNKAMLDPWTVVHLGAGLAAGLVQMSPWLALGGAIAYEFAEQQLERTDFGGKLFKTSGPESLGNAVVDVGVFALGYYLAQRYNRT
jgi:hypothetical protein